LSSQPGKSYSPISLPSTYPDRFDVLAKPYPPDPEGKFGGGFSSSLCSLSLGDSALLTVKPPRMIHGQTEVMGTFHHVNLIAAGTGVAPLLQIARGEVEAYKAGKSKVSLRARAKRQQRTSYL